jgi:hypothetical protein
MSFDGRVAPGGTLAGYRVLELAGRGGTGEVYRARDERLQRDVALKLLSPDFAADATFRARLVRESQLAASLDHPNVVPVYDAGESDGHVFIAMRFVDGTDLGAELRQGPMALNRVIDVAAQTADALDAAHQQGLVHRDVKPSNVLVDARGHCYLTDFGLSRSIGDPARAAGATLAGTVDYVAPEQVRGDDVDGRADLYALTCMLFEMLTGELPFRRTTDVATLFAHLEEDPPRAAILRPELPAAIDVVLARGLAKDPADRQDSCAVLVDEARTALGLTEPTRRRWRLLTAAGVVAVLAVVAVLLVRPWATEPAAPPTGSLVLIDPVSNAVTAQTPVPGYPSAVASAPGGVWMADFRQGVLWRYELQTGALQRISSPGEPRDLAVVGDDVYVASDGPELFSGNISRHDSRSGLREEALTLLACAVGSGDGLLWAAGCPFVQRLSTDGGPLKELATVLVPFADPLRDTNNRMQIRELAVGDGSVWVLGDAVDRRLWRLDELTGETQATIDLPFRPRSVAVGEGLVWITDPLDDMVIPVDPDDNTLLAPVPVGRGAAGVAAGAGAVWVVNSIDGTVSRIDPASRQAVSTIDVGGIPHELSVDDRGVWVTTHAR